MWLWSTQSRECGVQPSPKATGCHVAGQRWPARCSAGPQHWRGAEHGAMHSLNLWAFFLKLRRTHAPSVAHRCVALAARVRSERKTRTSLTRAHKTNMHECVHTVPSNQLTTGAVHRGGRARLQPTCGHVPSCAQPRQRLGKRVSRALDLLKHRPGTSRGLWRAGQSCKQGSRALHCKAALVSGSCWRPIAPHAPG